MALSWICIIALGALTGVVGQGIRVIVGLKKASDQAAALDRKFTEMVEPARLLISLLIGMLAGVMAAIVTLTPDAPVPRDALLGVAAAGYSGADFIEGFMARYLPGGRTSSPYRSVVAAAVVAAPSPPSPAVSVAVAGDRPGSDASSRSN
jgi:hypothetical protein